MNSVVRVCCCVNRISSGNPQFCRESISDLLEETRSLSADISLFPRLSLLPPSSGALLNSSAVAAQCEEALDQLRVACAGQDGCIVVGLVKRFFGKPVDVLAVIQNGKVLAYL